MAQYSAHAFSCLLIKDACRVMVHEARTSEAFILTTLVKVESHCVASSQNRIASRVISLELVVYDPLHWARRGAVLPH